MITYAAFQELDENLKAQVLWLDGVYLDLIRHTLKFNVELYALNDFYVELYFDDKEEPLFMNAFTDPARLEPYLDMVEVGEVLVTR